MTREEAIARIEEIRAEIRTLNAETRRLKMQHGFYATNTMEIYGRQDRKARGEILVSGRKKQATPPDNVLPIIQAWEAGHRMAEIAVDRGVARQQIFHLLKKWEARGFASRAKHEAAKAEIRRRLDAAQ